jgi:hypothetical protein
MELIILVDRPSQSHHTSETPISLDSGIKRYAIIFVKFSRGCWDRPLKIHSKMEAAKVLVSIGTKKPMIPLESIRSCRRAWATRSLTIQWSRIGSESSSEGMIWLDAHQRAADYPMIASTLWLCLRLSSVRSIQWAHCVPLSSIHAQ